MKENKFDNIGICIYTSISIILFVYVMPFIYIGFVNRDEPFLVNPTVMDLAEGVEHPTITIAAKYFAECITVRKFITIASIVILFAAQFLCKNKRLRYYAIHTFLWLSMGFFVFNFFGLVLLLLVM